MSLMAQNDSRSPSPKRSRLSDLDVKTEKFDSETVIYSVIENDIQSTTANKSHLLNELNQLNNVSSTKFFISSPEINDTTSNPRTNDKILEPSTRPTSNLRNSLVKNQSSVYQRFVHIPPAKNVKLDYLSNGTDSLSNQNQQNKEIAERAKQEANVLQRISQLRKQGLWSASRLPFIMEAKRRKGHWDYLVEEMKWMAVDFIEEKKWKKAAAKKLADAAQKYFLAREERLKVEEKETERQRQIIATSTSNIVKDWFENIKQRRESLFYEEEYQRIDLLSSKSIRMIDQVTDSCPQWFEDAADSECMLSGQDEDFVLPPNDMVDSESSFSESWEDKSLPCDDGQWWLGENAETEEGALKMEIQSLKEEGELPLADLLQNIPTNILSKPSKLQTSFESASTSTTTDYQTEVDELRTEAALPMEEILERHYRLSLEDLTEPPSDYVLSDADDDEESETSDNKSSVSSERDSFVSAESMSTSYHVECSKFSSASDMQVMASKLRYSMNNVKPLVQPSSLILKSSIDLPTDHISALTVMTTFHKENLPLLLLNCLDANEAESLIVQYVAHLATERCMWGPNLVVLPTNSLLDWRVRCMKIAPGLKVVIYSPQENEMSENWKMNDSNLCLVSYTDLRENSDYFNNQKWMTVICDQIHLLISESNSDSDSSKNKCSSECSTNCESSSVNSRLAIINKIPSCSQRIFVASWSDLSDLSISESISLMKLLLLCETNEELLSTLPPGEAANKILKKALESNQEDEESLEQIHKFLEPFVCRLDDEFENQVDEHVILSGLSSKQSSLLQKLRDSSKSQSTQKSGHLLDLLDVIRSARQVSCHPYLLESRTEVVPVSSPLVFPSDREEPLSFSLPGQVVKTILECRSQREQILLPRLLSPMSKDLGKFVRDRVFQLRPSPGMIEELANVDPSVVSTSRSCAETSFLTEEDHRQLRVERSQSLRSGLSSHRDSNTQMSDSIIEIRLNNNGLSRHHLTGTRISVTNGNSSDPGQFNGNASPNKQTVPGTTRPTFSNTTLAARRTRTLLKSRLTSLNRENERRCCLLQDSTQWFNPELRQLLSIGENRESLLQRLSSQLEGAPNIPFTQITTELHKYCFPVDKVISFPPLLTSSSKPCYNELLVQNHKLSPMKLHLTNLLSEISSICPHRLLSFPSFYTVRERSGKFWVLHQLLDYLLIERNQKLVLLGHMEEFLDLIEYWIVHSPSLRSIPRTRIDCQSEISARYSAVEQFNSVPDNQPFLLLLAGRTGEIGLNLLMPSTVIIVDVDWRPGVEDQLKTRLYRWALNSRSFSKQTFNAPPLKVFRLVSERTVEDYLFSHQGSRLLMQTVFTEKSATQPIVQARVQPNIIHGFLRGVGRIGESSGPGSTVADDVEEESCGDSEQSNRFSSRLESAAMSQSVAYFQRKVNLSEAAVERAVELFESPRDVASWCRWEGELKSGEAEVKGLVLPNGVKEKLDCSLFSVEMPLMSLNEDDEDEVKNYWNAIERWEVQQHARNNELEARRALLEEDDTILTYRHDILKDYKLKSSLDDAEMPTYCLSFDVCDEDHYIDSSHLLCYESVAMQDDELPPISVIPSPTYISPPCRSNTTGRMHNALARKRDMSWMRQRGQLPNRGLSGEGLDDMQSGLDSSFDSDQNLQPGTPKRRKLQAEKLRGMNSADAIGPPLSAATDNPACYGGMKGAPMKGKFDKSAPGYNPSNTAPSNANANNWENRLVTVTLVGNTTGSNQMRVPVTKPFYLRDVGNKNKLRRHCMQSGFPLSLQHQRLGLQGNLRLGAGLASGLESTSSYLMSKRPEFQGHEEAALYHSISQLQGLPFDMAAAERSPTSQTFLPNFALAELYLNDYVGSQCHRGTLQLAFYYDKLQNSQSSSFQQGGHPGMSNQTQGVHSAPGFGPGDSLSTDTVEPGTPGRKIKNKHKSPSINRFQAPYSSTLQTQNSLSGVSGVGYRSDTCSSEQVLSNMIKATLQKLVKRRMAVGPSTSVSTIKTTASGAAGTNTALANTASMTTSAMIQKNPTHIQTLQDLNINPEQLITPAIVLRNKEDKEEKDRLNKLAAANNSSDPQQGVHSHQQTVQTQQLSGQSANPVTVLQTAAQQGTTTNIGLHAANIVGSRLVSSNTIPSGIGVQQGAMGVQAKVGGGGNVGLPTVAVGQVTSMPQRFMSGRPGTSILVSSSTSVPGGSIAVGQGLAQIQQHTYKRSGGGNASSVIATTSRVGGAAHNANNSSVTRHVIGTGSNLSGTQRIQLPAGSTASAAQINQIVAGSGATVRQGIITQTSPGQIYAQMSRQAAGGSMIKRGGSPALNRLPGAGQVAGNFNTAATLRGAATHAARVQRPNAPGSINTTILRQRGQMGNSHVLKKSSSSGGGAGVVYNNLQIISSGSGVTNVVSSGGVSISGQAGGGISSRGNISTTTVTAQQIQQLILSGQGVVMANTTTPGQAVSGSLASLTNQQGNLQTQAQQRGAPEQIIISRVNPVVHRQNQQHYYQQQKNQEQ